MPAHHLLNRLQFKYHVNDTAGKHELTAFLPGNPEYEMGRMDWHTGAKRPAGEVSYINVPEELRRHGIATAMYNQAKEFDPSVHHSENRTPLGDKWAKKQGDPVPPLWTERVFGPQ